jgi:hypothetical protein
VLKGVVRANHNNAGIYGTVTRTGRLAVGQTIVLADAADSVGATSRRPSRIGMC